LHPITSSIFSGVIDPAHSTPKSQNR